MPQLNLAQVLHFKLEGAHIYAEGFPIFQALGAALPEGEEKQSYLDAELNEKLLENLVLSQGLNNPEAEKEQKRREQVRKVHYFTQFLTEEGTVSQRDFLFFLRKGEDITQNTVPPEDCESILVPSPTFEVIYQAALKGGSKPFHFRWVTEEKAKHLIQEASQLLEMTLLERLKGFGFQTARLGNHFSISLVDGKEGGPSQTLLYVHTDGGLTLSKSKEEPFFLP